MKHIINHCILFSDDIINKYCKYFLDEEQSSSQVTKEQ